jgi:hypothetical protein
VLVAHLSVAGTWVSNCGSSVRYFSGSSSNLPRTHFKTDFAARSSEKLVGKAGGEKGSEAYWGTSRTLFADNAVPRALQSIAAERSFEMGSRHS